MSWLLLGAGIAVVALAVTATRRRRTRRFDVTEATEINEQTEPRVRQFLRTGSFRITDVAAGVGDMRPETLSLLQEAEAASDLAKLDAFLADVRDSLGADEAVFWRWSHERDALQPAAWSTPGPRPLHFDRGWADLLRWSAEERMINFDADARIAVARLAAAPVLHEDRLMGVLSVARAEGLERGREHLKAWLPRHASQVGRFVSLFELRREYGRHMRQNQALLSAARQVQGHKQPEALNKAICENAVQVTSASDAALIRWRADTSQGWVHYATAGFRKRPPYDLSPESLVAHACTDGNMLLIEDVTKRTSKDVFLAEDDGGWERGTFAIVPLKLEEKVIGAIVVAAERPGIMSREEGNNVALLGALAATSLEMVWEMEEVTRRARTDALTGLDNRREFDTQLENMITHADRFGHSVSLIMADVDHFKQVNDNWGHEAGDVVLKSIALTLKEGVRAVDVCARFGGEEIAILLPQTTLPGAVELADRLRKAVAARPIVAGAAEIRVTISCGVACYPDGVITKEGLFAAADRALYEAKSAGRNCVKSAGAIPTGTAR